MKSLVAFFANHWSLDIWFARLGEAPGTLDMRFLLLGYLWTPFYTTKEV